MQEERITSEVLDAVCPILAPLFLPRMGIFLHYSPISILLISAVCAALMYAGSDFPGSRITDQCCANPPH